MLFCCFYGFRHIYNLEENLLLNFASSWQLRQIAPFLNLRSFSIHITANVIQNVFKIVIFFQENFFYHKFSEKKFELRKLFEPGKSRKIVENRCFQKKKSNFSFHKKVQFCSKMPFSSKPLFKQS